jgi:hypothetical protein
MTCDCNRHQPEGTGQLLRGLDVEPQDGGVLLTDDKERGARSAPRLDARSGRPPRQATAWTSAPVRRLPPERSQQPPRRQDSSPGRSLPNRPPDPAFCCGLEKAFPGRPNDGEPQGVERPAALPAPTPRRPARHSHAHRGALPEPPRHSRDVQGGQRESEGEDGQGARYSPSTPSPAAAEAAIRHARITKSRSAPRSPAILTWTRH